MSVSPANVTFRGEVGGPFPSPQNLAITVPGGGTWSTFDNSPWFDALPTSGSSGGATTLKPHTEGLTAGTYTYPITISAAGLPSMVMTITLVLTNPTATTTPIPGASTLAVSSPNVTFRGEVGGPFPSPQNLAITVPGGGTWSTFDDSPWFDALPISGSSGGATTLKPHTEGLTAGTYTQPITISAAGLPNLVLTITLVLTNPTAATASIPAAPSNLGASAVTTSQINLNWTDNSSNETGFKVERALSSSGPWTQIAVTSGNATSYADNGLTPSTLYYYRVRATNLAGDSAYSNQLITSTTGGTTTPPSAPSSLVAIALSSSQVSLRWTDNSNNELGVGVERSSSASGPWTQIGTTAAGATSYIDSGVSPSSTYFYRVTAFN